MIKNISPKVILSYFVILCFFVIISGCKSRENSIKQPESIQQTLAQVYTLYQQIGYDELDTLGKTVDRLNQIIHNLDSNSIKPPYYERIIAIRDRLSAYLTAYNEFYEEIYSVEDKLLSLENAYLTGKIEDGELKKWVKEEKLMLDDIDKRVRSMRQESDSTLYLLSGVEIDSTYCLQKIN